MFEDVLCYGPVHDLICNNTFRSFVHTNCNGRLGNVMMAYGTLYYFYRLGFEAVLDEYQSETLSLAFQTKSMDIKLAFITADAGTLGGERDEWGNLVSARVSSLDLGSLPVKPEFIGELDDAKDITYNNFTSRIENYRYNKSLYLGQYPTTFQLFVEIFPELIKQFQFLPEIQLSSKLAHQLATENIRLANPDKTIVPVGVHCRRGDYLESKHLQDVYSGEVMEKYFIHAMDILRKRLNSEKEIVIFLLLSDDEKWMKDIFGHLSDVVFPQGYATLPPPKMPARDLAIFQTCSHVIRSWGTYGLWAGLLSGGQILYPKTGRANREERHIEKMNYTKLEPIDIFQFFSTDHVRLENS